VTTRPNLKGLYAECTVHGALLKGQTIPYRRGVRLLAAVGSLRAVRGRSAVVLATVARQVLSRSRRNSWEYTGDGHALALRAAAGCSTWSSFSFHPTVAWSVVWPPSGEGHPRHRGRTLRRGSPAQLREKRFLFEICPTCFQGQYSETEEEATAGNTSRPGQQRGARRTCCSGRRLVHVRSTPIQGRPGNRRTVAFSWTSPTPSGRGISTSACLDVHQFKELGRC